MPRPPSSLATPHVTRRQVLQGTAAAAAGLLLGAGRRAVPQGRSRFCRRGSSCPARAISRLAHPGPTHSSGELLVGPAPAGAARGPVRPFGRVELIRPRDDGRTWSQPQIVVDSPLDDRDSGVLETRAGTLLVTTFTSLAYEPLLAKAEAVKPGQKGAWDPRRLARWQAARDALSADQRGSGWACGSCVPATAENWSPPPTAWSTARMAPSSSADGRLLYAGKDLWRPGAGGRVRVGDDGDFWRRLAAIPARPGDTTANYHELHAVETADGRLVVQIRNHNQSQLRRNAAKRIGRRRPVLVGATQHRRVGPPLAPPAAPRRPVADDLRASPPALRQPGPLQQRRRPHVVRAGDHLRRRRRQRPGLPLHRRAGRRLAAKRVVRIDARLARGRTAAGTLDELSGRPTTTPSPLAGEGRGVREQRREITKQLSAAR